MDTNIRWKWLFNIVWAKMVCKLVKTGLFFFYWNVVNRARKFKNDPCKLIAPLNKLILKAYQFNTVIKSLNIVFIGINIDFVISKLKAN